MSDVLDAVKHKINAWFKGKEQWQVCRDTALALVMIYYGKQLFALIRKKGLKNALVGIAISVASSTPGANALVEGEKRKEREAMEKSLIPAHVREEITYTALPATGLAMKDVLQLTTKWSAVEKKLWGTKKVSGSIYHGGDDLVKFMVEVYGQFALSNPLHPNLHPYVRKMESEVVRMTASLFNGDNNVCGFVTSGGTESILMAIKAYRDKAEHERGITEPELICARSAHAAFDKGCAYFKVKLVHVEIDPETLLIDVNQVKRLVNDNTICIVGSAPQFPHGVVDPIEQLAAIARKHNVGLHVDCCLGSFCIPFMEQLGYDCPKFDFQIPGVTSISIDTHKFGFSTKGSSVILFRDNKLRHYMYFLAPQWLGGVYASPTMAGSRPGALIAATWAVMVHTGYDGYREAASKIMKAAKAIEKGITNIPGLKIMGKPNMSVIAFGIDEEAAGMKLAKSDIYKVGESMKTRYDWDLNALQSPACLHICCTYMHRDMAEQFVRELRDSVDAVRKTPEKFAQGSVAIYGLAEAVGDSANEQGNLLGDLCKTFIDTLTAVPADGKKQ